MASLYKRGVYTFLRVFITAIVNSPLRAVHEATKLSFIFCLENHDDRDGALMSGSVRGLTGLRCVSVCARFKANHVCRVRHVSTTHIWLFSIFLFYSRTSSRQTEQAASRDWGCFYDDCPAGAVLHSPAYMLPLASPIADPAQ